ncbi:hypothetical protein AB0E56_18365 [Microbacterium sp. NPDC028030]|uniref:hypothetical protein n=1 Tax=Microbacterium sp. NPDC028030 TaxID=3155124 RepID=UPI0033F43AA5
MNEAITEHVAKLREWGEYRDRYPVLKVPYAERTLDQHLQERSINDLYWRRIMLLGVHDLYARVLAVAARLGVQPEDIPGAEVLTYLDRFVLEFYHDTHRERYPLGGAQ